MHKTDSLCFKAGVNTRRSWSKLLKNIIENFRTINYNLVKDICYKYSHMVTGINICTLAADVPRCAHLRQMCQDVHTCSRYAQMFTLATDVPNPEWCLVSLLPCMFLHNTKLEDPTELILFLTWRLPVKLINIKRALKHICPR